MNSANPIAQDPLAQLHDIHLPDTISNLPLAPGWWFLLGLIILSCLAAYYFIPKIRFSRLLQKTALIELQHIIEHQKNGRTSNNESIRKTMVLLKRLCLLIHPNQDTSSLTGNKWLTYLDNTGSTKFFSQHSELYQSGYRDPAHSSATNPNNEQSDNNETLKSLFIAAEHWIKKQSYYTLLNTSKGTPQRKIHV